MDCHPLNPFCLILLVENVYFFIYDQKMLYLVAFSKYVRMPTPSTGMVNTVNSIPAKHQHVNTVIMSMLACRY